MKILRKYTFDWWEIGLIKLCLISLGLILGIYFYKELAEFIWVWWFLFVPTAIYFIYRVFTGK